MSGYELLDESGVAYYAYHSDRDLCDDPECPCTLPSTVQRKAQERAEADDIWLVVPGPVFMGPSSVSKPMTGAEARARIDDLLAQGCRPKLLRVVEDYGR